jgi:hypothetical protein
MTGNDKNGILYCAIGKYYLKQAELSYSSFLRFNKTIPASIYTDQVIENNIWDKVITANSIEKVNYDNLMIYKLESLLQTPYQNTLYLDADTYILDDISDIFFLTEHKFDLAFCHGHHRAERFRILSNAIKSNYKLATFCQGLPISFAPLQGGLILFKKEQTNLFFQQVKSTYLECEYFDDQAIIRELLWKSDIRFYILPPEYNFNSFQYVKYLKKNDYRVAYPKLIHYTQNKGDDIFKIAQHILKNQSFISYNIKLPLLKFRQTLKSLSKTFKGR